MMWGHSSAGHGVVVAIKRTRTRDFVLMILLGHRRIGYQADFDLLQVLFSRQEVSTKSQKFLTIILLHELASKAYLHFDSCNSLSHV